MDIIDPFKKDITKLYRAEDIMELISYMKLLEERNEAQAEELKELWDKIVELERRVNFYRNANLPKEVTGK
tara:strand:+ start:1350 stop:1562 length:213 start_codon:yes stop_codon:yes gene_type:complete